MSAPFAKGSKFDPRIKPRMWGPLSAVQYAVRRNCDRLGLPVPVGYWPLWEDSGNKAHDIVSGLHGVNAGGKGYLDWESKFRDESIFVYPIGDGGDYVQVPYSPALNVFSITFVCEFFSYKSPENIASRGYDGSVVPYDLRIVDSSIEFGFYDGSWHKVSSNAKSTEVRHFTIGTYDGETLKIYVDGNLEGSTSYSGSLPSSSKDMLIGAYDDGTFHFLLGMLWHCLVFPSAFTEKQAQLLTEQPYALLQPVSRPIFFDVGAGTFITVSDSGSGADAISQISANLSVADAGSGAETLGQAASLTVQDTGTGADTVQGPSVTLTVQDTASAVDTVSQILAALTVGDTGAGAETISVDAGAIAKLVTDAGTGADTISVPSVELTVADTATGQDLIGAITALLTVQDSATAAELINVIKTKLVTVQDSGVGTDSVGNVNVAVTVSDIAQALDTIKQVTASLTVTDAGAGAESITAIDLALLPEGRVKITFTAKSPAIGFSAKQPGIGFTSKKPKIIIN